MWRLPFSFLWAGGRCLLNPSISKNGRHKNNAARGRPSFCSNIMAVLQAALSLLRGVGDASDSPRDRARCPNTGQPKVHQTLRQHARWGQCRVSSILRTSRGSGPTANLFWTVAYILCHRQSASSVPCSQYPTAAKKSSGTFALRFIVVIRQFHQRNLSSRSSFSNSCFVIRRRPPYDERVDSDTPLCIARMRLSHTFSLLRTRCASCGGVDVIYILSANLLFNL